MNDVTIAIPVYKVEDYIEECLQSAISQDYPNIRILVVDDCSPDACGDIVDRFAAEDDRIAVIHNESNRGLAAVRNTVLDNLETELLYWLDGDDSLEPDAISTCLAVMESSNADIVKTALLDREMPYIGEYSPDEYLSLLLPNIIQSNVIGCLMRRCVYNGVRHTEGLTLGDYETFPSLVENSSKIALEGSKTYRYRVMRPGSITASGLFSYRGYEIRAIRSQSRYVRYVNRFSYETIAPILSQTVDYACMGYLYAETEAERRKMQTILDDLSTDIYRDSHISSYKKFLVKSILESALFVPIARFLHKTKAKIFPRR